jgi:hypothetical protein
VPTTAILPDIGPKPIFKLQETLVSIGLRASPRQRGCLQHTVEALRLVGTQLKAFAIHFDQPHLTLSKPIREETHRHFV